MKMKFSISIFIFILPLIFFACKSDDIITPEINTNTEYFDWTIQDIPSLYTVYQISLGNSNNLFIAGNVSYKVSNGALLQLDFHDSNFRVADVKALDSSYAIFWGGNSSTGKSVFKIYDNGTIQSYEIPIYSGLDINIIYIIEKGKFMAFCNGSSGYYIFKNGVFTLRNKPNEGFVSFIGKSNNTNYLFLTDYSPFTNHNIYKIFGDSLVYVKTELNKPYAFATENVIMREEYYTTFQRFTYFNGTDWNTTLVNNDSASYLINFYNAGQSNNFFVNLTLDTTSYFNAKVWNGSTFTRQSNFPTSVKGTSYTSDQRISEYENGTFYFFFKNSTGKLLKGVRKN